VLVGHRLRRIRVQSPELVLLVTRLASVPTAGRTDGARRTWA